MSPGAEAGRHFRLLGILLLLVAGGVLLEWQVLQPRIKAKAQRQQQLQTAQAALAQLPLLEAPPAVPEARPVLQEHHWNSTETQYRLVRALNKGDVTLLEQKQGPVQEQEGLRERELSLKLSGNWLALQQVWQDWQKPPGMPIKALHLQNPKPQEQNPALQMDVTLSLLELPPDAP